MNIAGRSQYKLAGTGLLFGALSLSFAIGLASFSVASPPPDQPAGPPPAGVHDHPDPGCPCAAGKIVGPALIDALGTLNLTATQKTAVSNLFESESEAIQVIWENLGVQQGTPPTQDQLDEAAPEIKKVQLATRAAVEKLLTATQLVALDALDPKVCPTTTATPVATPSVTPTATPVVDPTPKQDPGCPAGVTDELAAALKELAQKLDLTTAQDASLTTLLQTQLKAAQAALAAQGVVPGTPPTDAQLKAALPALLKILAQTITGAKAILTPAQLAILAGYHPHFCDPALNFLFNPPTTTTPEPTSTPAPATTPEPTATPATTPTAIATPVADPGCTTGGMSELKSALAELAHKLKLTDSQGEALTKLLETQLSKAQAALAAQGVVPGTPPTSAQLKAALPALLKILEATVTGAKAILTPAQLATLATYHPHFCDPALNFLINPPATTTS